MYIVWYESSFPINKFTTWLKYTSVDQYYKNFMCMVYRLEKGLIQGSNTIVNQPKLFFYMRQYTLVLVKRDHSNGKFEFIVQYRV